MSTKYTFLLPAYKARFFEEALLSIKNQIYTDFLCIVSDDCSPEDLKSIFDKTVGDDSRFTFRRNNENMGSKSLVSHWNLLVNICETEFFIMASDDDVYENNFLEEIDTLAKKHPDVNLFRGRTEVINDNGKLLKQDPLLEEVLDRLHFLLYYYNGFIRSCEACFCYRLSEVRKEGLYTDYPLAIFTDDVEHIMLSKSGCASTPGVTFKYRESDLSLSCFNDTPSRAKLKIKSAMMFNDWFLEYYKTIEESKELSLKKELYNRIRGRIMANLSVLCTNLNLIDFCNLLRTIDSRFKFSKAVLCYHWLFKR